MALERLANAAIGLEVDAEGHAEEYVTHKHVYTLPVRLFVAAATILELRVSQLTLIVMISNQSLHVELFFELNSV